MNFGMPLPRKVIKPDTPTLNFPYRPSIPARYKRVVEGNNFARMKGIGS
jgi:hypothetical protein